VYGENMSHVKDKSKNEILEAMVGTAMPTSPAHEQQKAGIIVRCTEDIEKSIKSLENQLVKNADASDRMGEKVFWLNIILAVATLVGAVATVVIAIKTP
ncbi:hypothetical protein ACVDQD_003764, partial [Vibrio cholerae]